MEKENKKLSAQLQYNKIPNPIKEESKSDIKTDKNTLIIQNENLKTKNKRLTEKLKTLEKYIKDKKPKPYGYNPYSSSAKKYPNIYQVNDYEKLITHLQQSLKTFFTLQSQTTFLSSLLYSLNSQFFSHKAIFFSLNSFFLS